MPTSYSGESRSTSSGWKNLGSDKEEIKRCVERASSCHFAYVKRPMGQPRYFDQILTCKSSEVTALLRAARQLDENLFVASTSDQRLRVFVSSTLQELAGERQAARAVVEQLRLVPVIFELGARPHPPQELYRAYLDQSHVFVGIYWQKYGWVASEMDISGLEDEWRLSGDKPKLIYIKTPAPDREPRLKGLLDQIRSNDTLTNSTTVSA
jgi:hypothetical protein